MSTDTHASRRLRLPVPPTLPKRAPFPLVAVAAPVVLALVIWAVTRSPFALVFAALGPVVAIASVLDSSVAGRRSFRRDRGGYMMRLNSLEARIAEFHADERRISWSKTPTAMDSLLAGRDDPARWRSIEPRQVVIGSGRVPSALLFGGGGALDGDENDRDGERLRSLASMVDDMPVVLPVQGGIGIAGQATVARSVLRGILLQICSEVGPERLRVIIPDSVAWEWAGTLPHVRDGGEDADTGQIVRIVETNESGPILSAPSDPDELLLAIAPSIARLPSQCVSFLSVSSAIDLRIVRPVGLEGDRILPELVGEEQAMVHAGLLARAAESGARHGIPSRIDLRDLLQGGTGLACTVGMGENGPVGLDLVADGPHAVIGGTTGSGKSDLLVTWIAGMATNRTPAEFSFVLIDFKGGATAAQVQALPHCAGVVSDLDPQTAARAFAGLSAEILRREAALAAVGARDIIADAEHGLGRLVVVIDEFQAVLAASPELHTLFVDLAARGRSLGVHLILCTQRPAGVVRDALLANCALRISLRVNDSADSVAVVGVPRAARLSRSTPGRCIIATPDGPVEAQVALAGPQDLTALAGTNASRAPVWLDALPASVGLADALAIEPGDGLDGVVLGVVDVPREQRRGIVRWDPLTDGHLAVIGSARCGASSVLASIAEQADTAVLVGADPETLWDVLAGPPSALEGNVLLLDDWDAASAMLDAEHRTEASERLMALMRSGTTGVVIVTHRPAAIAFLGSVLRVKLVLRIDDRSDHLQSGAAAEHWDPRALPGRGSWGGDAFQAIRSNAPQPKPAVASARRLSTVPGAVVVVAPMLGAATTRLAAAGRHVLGVAANSGAGLEVADSGRREALIGDVDAWLARPGLLATLKTRVPVVFDGCTPGDFRAISRIRALPPALQSAPGRGWLLWPDGRIERVVTDA